MYAYRHTNFHYYIEVTPDWQTKINFWSQALQLLETWISQLDTSPASSSVQCCIRGQCVYRRSCSRFHCCSLWCHRESPQTFGKSVEYRAVVPCICRKYCGDSRRIIAGILDSSCLRYLLCLACRSDVHFRH